MNAIKDYKIRIPQVISINWIGFYTLYKKEILRFLNVWIQTVFSPVVTLILFLAVFTIALGLNRNNILGHEYGVFILPGLICMQILQNAFANTSSSLMIAKVQGNIVDILYPPLSPMEVTAAMLLGAITRGLIIGFFSVLIIIPFAHVPVHNVFIILLFALLGSSMLACLDLLQDYGPKSLIIWRLLQTSLLFLYRFCQELFILYKIYIQYFIILVTQIHSFMPLMDLDMDF
jgi:ABC-2 type transport system permease protein